MLPRCNTLQLFCRQHLNLSRHLLYFKSQLCLQAGIVFLWKIFNVRNFYSERVLSFLVYFVSFPKTHLHPCDHLHSKRSQQITMFCQHSDLALVSIHVQLSNWTEQGSNAMAYKSTVWLTPINNLNYLFCSFLFKSQFPTETVTIRSISYPSWYSDACNVFSFNRTFIV